MSGKRKNTIRGKEENDVLKGMAAGIIGGLVAAWTMENFKPC